MHIAGTNIVKTFDDGLELRKDIILGRFFFIRPPDTEFPISENNRELSILYDTETLALEAGINNAIEWEKI